MRKKNRDSYAVVDICIHGRAGTLPDPMARWIYITRDNGCRSSSMNPVCAWLLVSLAMGTSERIGKTDRGETSTNTAEYSASTVCDSFIIVACIVLIVVITAMSWRRSIQRRRYPRGVILIVQPTTRHSAPRSLRDEADTDGKSCSLPEETRIISADSLFLLLVLRSLLSESIRKKATTT